MSERSAGSEPAPEEFDVAVGGGFFSRGPEGIGESFFLDAPAEDALELPGGPDADPAIELRRTMGMFATGVTVITTQAGEQVHGMTANAFMSVSLRPPLVLISVDKRAKMHALLHEGKRYGISVLAEGQSELSDQFAGRVSEEMLEARFDVIHDTPLVEGALAHLVAHVVRSYWGGDHSLFLGRVEYARYGEGAPLLFHGGQYEHLTARVPLFSALSPELLEVIMAAGERRAFAEGETVVREGEEGDVLFVLLEGTARVERSGRLLQELGQGDFFGEVAVLDGRPRSADVITTSPVVCLTVSRDILRLALESEPRAAWSMLEILARRLRED